MLALLTACSKAIVPFLLLAIPLWAHFKRVPLFTSFVAGAKDSLGTVLAIFPHLVGMMVAVAVFRASGVLDLGVQFLAPCLQFLSIPEAVFPIGLLRPLSGIGSLAFVEDILRHYGPDSFLGILASTIQGSTDTTLYVLTVYFGAVGIQRARYAPAVGLVADLVGFLASIFLCRWWFG